MKVAYIGTDYVSLNESNMMDYVDEDKIHLIKLDFEYPSEQKVNMVLKAYPRTNRYVIENNIKLYNDILKKTTKKYYIENSSDSNKIFTFFRKNNKVLFNFTKLKPEIKEFLLDNFLFDILRNTEVIILDRESLEKKATLLEAWPGNVVIQE